MSQPTEKKPIHPMIQKAKDESIRSIKTFRVIREIRKNNGVTVQEPIKRFPSLSRTPEEQTEYEAKLFFEAAFYSRAAQGLENSEVQSKKAKLPRGVITEIIGKLALAPEHKEESAKQLWRLLYGELDERYLAPKEFAEDNDPSKWWYEYDHKEEKEGRKKITLGQFQKRVSEFRTGKKLP